MYTHTHTLTHTLCIVVSNNWIIFLFFFQPVCLKPKQRKQRREKPKQRSRKLLNPPKNQKPQKPQKNPKHQNQRRSRRRRKPQRNQRRWRRRQRPSPRSRRRGGRLWTRRRSGCWPSSDGTHVRPRVTEFKLHQSCWYKHNRGLLDESHVFLTEE